MPKARLRDFLGLYFHDPAVGLLRAAEANLVAATLLDAPLLDIGTGDGTFAARALTDPAMVGVERVFSRARLARSSGAYRCVVVADAQRLPFRDQVFASVLSNSTFEHIPGIGDVLHEAARVLRPDGRLLFTVHNDRFAQRVFFWGHLFAALRRPQWLARYRLARLRRLAMHNLLDDSAWRHLLDSHGLEVTGVRGYLGGRAERLFEISLVVSRLGLGRLNVGAALRCIGRALDAVGIRRHRRLAGAALARLLQGAQVHGGRPTALAIEAARRPRASRHHER